MLFNPTSQVTDESRMGFQMQTGSPNLAYANFQVVAGVLDLALVICKQTGQINKLGVWVLTAGATPGAGFNGLAIYSANNTGAACNLLGQTASMSAQFGAAGFAEANLTAPVNVTAGTAYYLAMLSSFTTEPFFMGFTTPPNGPPLMNGYLDSGLLTAQNVFPASFLISALTTDSGTMFETAR
jgi:hypothetical protein